MQVRSRHVIATVAATLSGVGAARAETAIPVESCASAWWARHNNETCRVAGAGALYCDTVFPALTSQCWDFEGGLGDNGFGGWSASGTAFDQQPVVGDNVNTWRATFGEKTPTDPTRTVFSDLDGIGGDYWNVPYPIGHQGQAWIGSFDRRPALTVPWGTFVGDAPVGALVSPTFTIDRQAITFLIGGGGDVNQERIELQVLSGRRWLMVAQVTGNNSELLERKQIVTAARRGQTARLIIVDNGTSTWGHINIDHIEHTDRVPTDYGGSNRPLWGFADTHAHVGNHQAFQAVTPGGGHLFEGSPLGAQFQCDGAGHGLSAHGAGKKAVSAMELTSFGTAPGMPEGCSPSSGASNLCTFSPFAPVFAGGADAHSPNQGGQHWYSRTHQQMYVDWMRRAYAGGQRLLVASAGNNEVVSAGLRASLGDLYLTDYGALRRFAAFMKALAAANPWMEIALTPAEARRIVRQHKLAVVLATEVEDIGDNCALSIGSTDASHDGASTTETPKGQFLWTLTKTKSTCVGDAAWNQRLDSLRAAGYRLITPVHFADNALGGSAIYTDAHAIVNRFENAAPFAVTTSPGVRFRLGEANRRWADDAWTNYGQAPDPVAAWHAKTLAWCQNQACFNEAGFGLLAMVIPISWLHVIAVVTQAENSTVLTSVDNPLPAFTGFGHLNATGLTAQGRTVLAAMKARGMLIDLAHLSERGREQVLGLGATASTDAIINPGCDLTTAACQAGAYPVLASHAGLRDLQATDERNEGGLTPAMIERIRAIGGTIGVGTSGGDGRSATEAAPTGPDGMPWSGIFAQTVVNDCAGSSKTFSQGYLYALRVMGGKGITLGTDANGFDAMLNPRFGTLGCYARGNVPRILEYAADDTVLIDQDHPAVPFLFSAEKIRDAGWQGTAGGQRWVQRESTSTAPGLSAGVAYAHYGGTPPSGVPATGDARTGFKFLGFWDPVGYDTALAHRVWNPSAQSRLDPVSMRALTALPALKALVTNGHTFDFNYDGLANYGLLPDLLQDTRSVGLSQDQLTPLFQGAEAVVQLWEKACRLSDPTKSLGGC